MSLDCGAAAHRPLRRKNLSGVRARPARKVKRGNGDGRSVLIGKLDALLKRHGRLSA